MLREQGDFGEEAAKVEDSDGVGDRGRARIEDRLITASLRAYDGAEREEVVNLFHAFAVFPEDVPVF